MASANGKNWKAVTMPFEKIAGVSGAVYRRYELSDRTVAMLLSQTAYMHWPSRWDKAEDLTLAQKELIRGWAQQAEAELFAICTKEQKAVYPANDPKITYEPNDPYNTPDLIPEGGYIVPPWYTNPSVPLPGVEANDAMVNLLGLPALAGLPNIDVEGLLAAGLPRFRINNLEDGQTVAIHFVAIPNGGQALVTIDGGVSYVNVVDLNTNLTALPLPEFPGEQIEEVTITGEGEHFIDVTFIPVVDDELLLPVQFGGGLRKVTITQTVDTACEDEGMTFDVRQNDDEPCILEKNEDNAGWTPFADLTLCLKSSIIADPSGGLAVVSDGVVTPIGSAPGDADPRSRAGVPRTGTDDEIKCLAAANASNVMWQLVEQSITEIKKYSALSLLLLLSFVLSLVFGAPWGALAIPAAPAAAAFVVLASLSTGSFTAKEFREFACILKNNCTVSGGVAIFDFNAVKVAVVGKQPSWGFNVWNAVYALLDVIGADGLNLAGETTAITDTCCDFCSTGTQTTYLYLQDEPFAGVLASKNSNNINLLTRNASGLGIQGNGTTLFARWDWSFITPPGCEVTDLGVYMPTFREPIFVSLFLNGSTAAYKTYSNYRPFGNHHYNGVVTLRPGVNTLMVSMYHTATTTAEAYLQRIYAVYRGCDPFEYYR